MTELDLEHDTGPSATPLTIRDELRARIGTLEESYEFFLAYAAQGQLDDAASPSGARLRDFLARSLEALDGLASLFAKFVEDENRETAEDYRSFLDVLAGDATSSRAAIGLVSVQPSISSQLIDNLNASIHLRALLTDVFLIDEILKLGTTEVSAVDERGEMS